MLASTYTIRDFSPLIMETPQEKLVFEVANRRDSSVTMEMGGEMLPVNTSKSREIPILSRVVVNDQGAVMDAQYVPGANTIFIHDYIDHKGEKQPGLRSIYGETGLKEQYRRAKEKPLTFDYNGTLFLSTKRNDPMLVLFLKTHPYNQTAQFKANVGVLPLMMFKELKSANKQKSLEDTFVNEDMIMQRVYSLFASTGTGVTYKEHEINAISRIYNVDGKYPTIIDRYQFIRSQAKQNPRAFDNVIKSAMENVRIDIGKAVSYKVISFGKGDLKIVRNGKPHAILSYTNEETAMDEVAYWLMGSQDGLRTYAEIIDGINTAAIAGVSLLK